MSTVEKRGTGVRGPSRPRELRFDKPYLTIKEAQAYLGIGHTKFYGLAREGVFLVRNLGDRKRLIEKKSIDRWLDSLPKSRIGDPEHHMSFAGRERRAKEAA